MTEGMIACEQCGEEFHPHASGQKYCSKKCGAQWRGRKTTKDNHGLSSKRACHDCGKMIHDYRCRACWDKRNKEYGVTTGDWEAAR